MQSLTDALAAEFLPSEASLGAQPGAGLFVDEVFGFPEFVFFCMFKIKNEDEKMNVNPTFGFRVRV